RVDPGEDVLEAILLTMQYGSSTAASRSDTPPISRDIHVQAVTCESAGAAIEIQGLPEQPIEHVVLEDVRLKAVRGIHCADVDDLVLAGVRGIVEQEPLFACSSVRGLNVTGMSVIKPERGEP
ncbi:MAG TPA: hypothetical protein VLC52_10435, partial [Anaerolineae bacterium]|nr:hypothetical protein [Anaerolineae bacterium]